MANVFSGLTDSLSGGAISQGQDQLAQAANNIYGVATPNLQALIPILQQQVASGKITAEQAQAALQKASETAGVQANPELVADQMSSLGGLKTIATQGGMTAIDKAQLADIQNATANKNAAEQAAIKNQAQQQGVAGQGFDLASRLNASQGNANAQSLAGQHVASDAQARSLAALQAYGTQAGNVNTQQFDQAMQKANAQDAINKFNAANSTAASNTNAILGTQANTANVNNANTINATNTGIVNKNATMPYDAAQAQFKNSLDRATNASSALTAAGNANIKQGNTNATNNSGYIDAAGKLVNGAADAYGGWGAVGDTVAGWFSDKNMKCDVKPADDDIYAMMENLTGKKWKYKPSSVADDGGKEHIGPMAQDVEKAGLPVANTAHGKMIEFGPETQSQMLAALANLHARTKELEKK